MEYQIQLIFLQQLLQDLHISSCVVKDPETSIPSQIDLHLRADLFGVQNYTDFLQNSMSQAKEHTLYRFYDEYNCNYIFLRLPEKDGYFFIGPYLKAMPSKQWLTARAADLALSPEQLRQIELYYTVLPLMEDENLLLSMAGTFATHLWGSPEQYALEFVDYAIPDRYEPIPCPPDPAPSGDALPSLSVLETGYANENKLMDAVSKGKLQLVTAMAAPVFNNAAQQRLTDSLRDRKNYLVILKTLLRKAAEQGGVHSLHIHRLSSHYATTIENIRTIKESFSLQEEMIRSFCQLVKRHSLSRYSYYVGQAITLVQYDLSANLSLNTIAKRLNVNSSYLSALFHKEYGCTLTAFINRQRIDHGILLLRLTSKPVQEIAADCGIHDVNYFIKLFKKQTGLTPSRYRQHQGQQAR